MKPTNIKIFLLCPVPQDQKPITEYLNLQKNSVTEWTTFSQSRFEKELFSYARSFSFFLSFFTLFSLSTRPFGLWVLEVLCLTNLFLFFFCFFIWFRWIELEKRLKESRLIYEEASWYDGERWEKPFSILRTDRLLATQRIQPIQTRLFALLGKLSFVIFSFFFFFFSF
jgi:hypothetical protein